MGGTRATPDWNPSPLIKFPTLDLRERGRKIKVKGEGAGTVFGKSAVSLDTVHSELEAFPERKLAERKNGRVDGGSGQPARTCTSPWWTGQSGEEGRSEKLPRPADVAFI